MIEEDNIFHPAAKEFPLLEKTRLETLTEDIRKNGQKETIKTLNGLIVDGRNRFLACLRLGLEPRMEAILDTVDPWAYVWSLNGERRDLTQDQRYLIWKSVSEKSEVWQAEQQRIQDEANRKRSEAAKAQPRTETGFAEKPKEQVVPQTVGTPGDKNKGSVAKAKASKTNRGSVERMDTLSAKRPDLAEKVKIGELTSADAIREMKRTELIENLESISTRKIKEIQGVYDVVIIDPPWPMQKIERDLFPEQVGLDYPVMSEKELSEFEIPAAQDCHLWLWTTHRFMPIAFRLLDIWEFKYVCAFVWNKPGGFQPIGLPQYNCEFALYARKGTPKFIDTKMFFTCFNAPRGKHSEKPEEFYEMIRRVTAGRRIDIFNRRLIEGFETWGKEAEVA